MLPHTLATILFPLFLLGASLGQIPHKEDYELMKFLNETMKNYTKWGSSGGLLPPMPGLINLQEQNLDGVDINVEIIDPEMTGYFDTTSDSYDTTSTIRDKLLGVTRNLNNESITFSGDYAATGLLKVNATFNVTFSGEGSWTLKTVDSIEDINYFGYTIVDNEYIDLTASERMPWGFIATWESFRLPGITFDYEGDADANWTERISQVYVKIFERFLNRGIDGADIEDLVPPRKLLNAFLVQKVSPTKLSEIISGWGQTTTPSTPSPSTGSSTIILNFWLSLVLVAIMFTLQ